MKIIRMGDRSRRPSFFDMSGQFRPVDARKWYGVMFRIGDKAVIHAHLRDWRRRYPERKLVVTLDPQGHETAWARPLQAEWYLKDIADELWIAEQPNAPISRPPGDPIYTEHLFASWRKLQNQPQPPVTLTVDAGLRAALRTRFGLTAQYAVVHPLLDAKYDQHRNLTVAWWQQVIGLVAARMPTVLIGTSGSGSRLAVPATAIRADLADLSALDSLALISGAERYIGGETGMTLWAALLKVPVYATYRYWHVPWPKNLKRGLDTRPISFGAPVRWVPVGPQARKWVGPAVALTTQLGLA